MRTRLKKSGYDVDPRLVAAAILERLDGRRRVADRPQAGVLKCGAAG